MSTEDDLTRPDGRYQRIARQIRDAIRQRPDADAVPRAGEYWPGDMLPSETELARRFQVSRQTVRAAIALLVGEGLVTVEHGRGTFVKHPTVRLRFDRFARHTRQPGMGPWESACAAQGVTGFTEMVVVDHRPATPEVARELDIPVGELVVYRRRYMHAGSPDTILQIQEGYMPLDVVAGTDLAEAPKVADGIYAALDRIGHGPARVVMGEFVRTADHTESTVFGQPGAPVLQTNRTTYDATGRAVEWLVVVATTGNYFVYDLPVD